MSEAKAQLIAKGVCVSLVLWVVSSSHTNVLVDIDIWHAAPTGYEPLAVITLPL